MGGTLLIVDELGAGLRVPYEHTNVADGTTTTQAVDQRAGLRACRAGHG
jgi:hypothetical protein